MCEDGDYAFFHVRLCEYYLWLAENYCHVKDDNGACEALEKAFDHARAYDNLPENYVRTSLLWVGEECACDKYHSAVEYLLEQIKTHENYAVIRENERLMKIAKV